MTREEKSEKHLCFMAIHLSTQGHKLDETCLELEEELVAWTMYRSSQLTVE